eukprot:snap_masked-scaffold_45-processed-gene-1.104-mRNA-1 protein AED:1.00 eAED:1.00 QI:0/0/0/0/1/1/2/0/298
MENLRKEPYTGILDNESGSYIYPITESFIYKYDYIHRFIVQKHTKPLLKEIHFRRAFESHRHCQTVEIEINKGEVLTDEIIKILTKCIMLLKENVVIILTFFGFSAGDIVDPTLLGIKKFFLFEKMKKVFISWKNKKKNKIFVSVNFPVVFELIDDCFQKEDSFILQDTDFLTKEKPKALILYFSLNKYTTLKHIRFNLIRYQEDKYFILLLFNLSEYIQNSFCVKNLTIESRLKKGNTLNPTLKLFSNILKGSNYQINIEKDFFREGSLYDKVLKFYQYLGHIDTGISPKIIALDNT